MTLYTGLRCVMSANIGYWTLHEIEYDRSSRPHRDGYRSWLAILRHSPRIPPQTTFSDDHMHIPGEASHAGSWNQGKGAG